MMRAPKEKAKVALFPEGYRCLLCNKETETGEDGLCAGCRESLARPKETRTLPLVKGEIRCSFLYDGAAKNGMRLFKYEGHAWLAPVFVRNVFLEDVSAFDCVVPVPMHPVKRYFRGYNPAELIARALLRRYPGPELRPELLKRTRLTVSQTKKNRTERRLPGGLYRARPEAAGLNVLLVDDVITTGATLTVCAAALIAAGAASVSAVCGCSAERRNEDER